MFHLEFRDFQIFEGRILWLLNIEFVNNLNNNNNNNNNINQNG
jgi:hypothetical protein